MTTAQETAMQVDNEVFAAVLGEGLVATEFFVRFRESRFWGSGSHAERCAEEVAEFAEEMSLDPGGAVRFFDRLVADALATD